MIDAELLEAALFNRRAAIRSIYSEEDEAKLRGKYGDPPPRYSEEMDRVLARRYAEDLVAECVRLVERRP